MSYSDFANKTRSEKVILVTAEASKEVKLFALHSGAIYLRTVEHFVSMVKVAGANLVKASSSSLLPGQFYFDAKNMALYVRLADDSDPKTKTVSLTYRFFWANAPLVLANDLASGEQVEWEARVQSIGSLGQQLDDQNTGIVLESSSTISLENSDGYFSEIFDTLIWENKTIEFYSWSPSIELNQAVKLFSGVIESKAYDTDKITFKVKDFVYKLKNLVNLSVFTEADGNISPSLLGTPKRRIYGKVKQVKTVGIDNILGGYPLSGTISVSQDSTALTGTGTAFLSQLSPGDELYATLDDGSQVKISIDSIESDTAATLGDESDYNITNKTAIVKPKIPYRMKNRRWHIAGHKLRQPVANIVFPTNSRRLLVDSVEDFEPDDLVTINLQSVNIKRLSGNNVVLESSLFPLPDIGNVIEKNPVTKVYFGSKEMVFARDWTLTNFPDAVIEIDPLAEFNLANAKNIGVNLVFTNASRTVTTAATIDLRTLMKPRDWIRKNSISEPDWYEVLDVKEQSITLRTPFAGTTQTTTGKVKNVDLIADDSLITVDCLGMAVNSGPDFGKWIKTPSDAVKHLVTNDAGFSDIDTDSFNQAKADCPYVLSMVIPESIGAQAPTVRDVITKINESVFGSLYGNKTMQISYSILNARKPTDLAVIKDDDIISWESVTEQKIANKIKINYRPFTDIYNGQDGFEIIEFDSDFVDEFIGIKNTEEKTIYLYEPDKALIIAQRIAFHRSLSNCKISMVGKLNLAQTTVNDKIYIEFDRLFKRYGGRDTKKIAIVTGIKKNGLDVEVEMTDLGNIFNRVPSIAPTGLDAYSTASAEDGVKYGFIVDNFTLTPDVSSERDLGNNRIG